MKFSYLWDQFKYCLKKSTHPKRNPEIKRRPTFFIDGAVQSHVDADTLSANCLPSSHPTSPPLPSDADGHAHTPVHPSHSPNITSLNFSVYVVVSPLSSHMHSCLWPPSSHSGVPSNDYVLCSSILDSSFVVNEEQPINRVGIAQPTCSVIHDDSLLSDPPPFFPNLFREPAIHDFACVSSSTVAPIVDHSQDSLDVSPSFNNREDKLPI